MACILKNINSPHLAGGAVQDKRCAAACVARSPTSVVHQWKSMMSWNFSYMKVNMMPPIRGELKSAFGSWKKPRREYMKYLFLSLPLALSASLSLSLLPRAGQPRMQGGQHRGAVVRDARRNKERIYPELLQDLQCRLIVLGIEMGERWGGENATFLIQNPLGPRHFAPIPHHRPDWPVEQYARACSHACLRSFPPRPIRLPQDQGQRLFNQRDPRKFRAAHTCRRLAPSAMRIQGPVYEWCIWMQI